jgi:hypothetical protein
MSTEKNIDINKNHIILGFFEFNYSPDLITDNLGLVPLEQGVKGEKYLTGKRMHIEKIREYNIWTYEWKIVSNELVTGMIANFIDDIIVPRIDKIKKLTVDCNVQLRIVQYYYDGYNPVIYIKREHNKVLAEINSSLDLDLYCLK